MYHHPLLSTLLGVPIILTMTCLTAALARAVCVDKQETVFIPSLKSQILSLTLMPLSLLRVTLAVVMLRPSRNVVWLSICVAQLGSILRLKAFPR